MKYLIEKGAKIDAVDEDGDTPILYSIERGNMEMFKLLLQFKPNLTLKNKAGKTAVDLALEVGQPEMHRLLLEAMK